MFMLEYQALTHFLLSATRMVTWSQCLLTRLDRARFLHLSPSTQDLTSTTSAPHLTASLALIQ